MNDMDDLDNDDDIEADNAHERQHQRQKTVRRGLTRERHRGLTPVTGFTAGTWSQVLLATGFSAALGTVSGTFSPPISWGLLWTLLGGAALSQLTWRAIGRRGRDVMRTGVRVIGVVALVGLALALLWRVLR
jgi:hypothetical protein